MLLLDLAVNWLWVAYRIQSERLARERTGRPRGVLHLEVKCEGKLLGKHQCLREVCSAADA